MYDLSVIGRHIRFFRRQAGMTQSELAEKTGVSFQAVSGWENGQSVPDIENLCRLAVAFNVSLDALLQNDKGTVMAAVDGGGTKSEFVLFSSDGTVLDHFRLSGTNIAVSGYSNVIETFCRGIDRCISARVDTGTVYIGTAGPRLDDVRQELSSRYPQIKFTVESDGVNALFSDDGDAALICGTGSLLITKEGNAIRTFGGWGYLLGDPGSAYNFGRALLKESARFEDFGVGSKWIHESVCARLNSKTVRGTSLSDRIPFVASLAGIAFEAVRAGDEAAKAVLQTEAQDLARLIDDACRDGTRLILCGGIFEHYGADFLPVLKEYVEKDVTFIVPKLPPVYGACVRCASLAGVPCTDSFRTVFARTFADSTD